MREVLLETLAKDHFASVFAHGSVVDEQEAIVRTIQCRAVLFGDHGCRVVRDSLLLERKVRHDDPTRQHRNPLYVFSFQLLASLNDAPGRYANDDNIRSNLRAHEESVADMLHHARVDARGKYPRSRRLGCFQEATFEHLTEPGLQFEILYTTVNTDNLDRETKSGFSLCAADVWCRAYEIGQLQSPLLGEQMRDLRRIGIVRQTKIMRFAGCSMFSNSMIP